MRGVSLNVQRGETHCLVGESGCGKSVSALAVMGLLVRGAIGIEAIVAGGDDYEILCAVPEAGFDAFAQAADLAGVAISSIGTIIAGAAIPRFLDLRGSEIALQRLSYSNF